MEVSCMEFSQHQKDSLSFLQHGGIPKPEAFRAEVFGVAH